jgi:thiol-disulfide isomerase/thioredoxin
MKKLVFYSLSIFFSLCCFAQPKWFTIKAFLPRWNGAEISLLSKDQVIYTNKVEKDIFSYTDTVENITEGTLRIKSGKNIFFVPVFLEPGTIKVRDAGGRQVVSFGTVSNDTYLELNKRFDSLAAQSNEKGFSKIFQYKRNLAAEFISKHPSSIVSVQLLKDYFHLSTVADDTIYYSLAHSLNSSFPNSVSVAQMLKEADVRFVTAKGRTAPKLHISDTTGNTKPIYTEGEITFIDFWASWCVPCRKENLALKKIFDKYHSSGFTITSVSLDSKKSFWKNAIKQDRLTWLQLSDLKGWDGTPAQVYGIKAIPMNFLINKDGSTVAKNLSADQLDKLLNTLIEKKAF